MNTKKFTHLDANGKAWGVVSVDQLWANVYAIKYNRPEISLDQMHWKKRTPMKKWKTLFKIG